MAKTAEIICEQDGAAGLITLNRPQALNALTLDMVAPCAARSMPGRTTRT